MPFKSKAQQRWGNSSTGQKALGGKENVSEWNNATDFKHLPEKAMATKEVNLGKKHESFKVKEGSLHKMLGISEDKKIGDERLHKALHSQNPTIRRKAASGIGLSHMKKG